MRGHGSMRLRIESQRRLILASRSLIRIRWLDQPIGVVGFSVRLVGRLGAPKNMIDHHRKRLWCAYTPLRGGVSTPQPQNLALRTTKDTTYIKIPMLVDQIGTLRSERII